MANKLGQVVYGVLIFWNATTHIPSILYSSATVAMERYIPEKQSLDDKKVVFWGLFKLQILLILVSWISLFLVNKFFINWEPWKNSLIINEIDFSYIVIFIISRHLLNIIVSTIGKCALGFKNITLVQSTVAAKSIIDAIGIIILYLVIEDIQKFLILAVLLQLSLELLFSVFWIVWLKKTFVQFNIGYGSLEKVWKKEIKLFSGPSIITNIMSSAKEKIPIILLGDSSYWGASATYSVVYKIFQFFSKLFSTICTTLLPLLIDNKKGINLQSVMSKVAPIYHGIFGIILILTSKYWLMIWNIDLKETDAYFILVYTLIFICTGPLRSIHTWLDFHGMRKHMMNWSIIRGCVFLVLIVPMGASVTLMALCELLAIFAALLYASLLSLQLWPNKFSDLRVSFAFFFLCILLFQFLNFDYV